MSESNDEAGGIPGLLGPPVGYTDLLDAAMTQKQEEENAKPRSRNPLRPSASGFCARKLAFEYNEFKGNARYEPEVRNPATMRLLNLGNNIEFHALRIFQDAKIFDIKYKQQTLTFTRINEEQLIEGSIDFVIYLDKYKAVGDVKSKGDKFSSYRNSKWDEIDDELRGMSSVQTISETAYWVEDLPAFLKELKDPFFKHNFVQLNYYACTDFMRERGIDHAFIYQYNKNNSRHREVRFKPSQAVADYVNNKFLNVADAIDNHKDPMRVEREYSIGTMSCAFCQFNKICYPANDAKKEFFANWPDKDWPKDTNRLGARGEELEEIYGEYAAADLVVGKKKQLEERIIHVMDNAQVRKIRFADGNVFELKHLKSPFPHIELRRSKV